MPADKEMPSTIRRSDKRAQEIWIKTHDSAVETYGEGQRAHRVAFASLKHNYEKIGDHWEPKTHRGPSDPRATRGLPDIDDNVPDYGGVDAEGHTREELVDIARRLGVGGPSRMRKDELAEAINRANRRLTAQARQREK